MAEGNGQNHETRISVLEEARKNIEDSLLVMSHLEARQSRLIRDLADEQDEQSRKFAEQGERIDKLVSAIGQLIARIPPENLR